VTVPAAVNSLPVIRDAVERLCPDDVPVPDRGRFETAVFALTTEIIERAAGVPERSPVVIDLTLRYDPTGLTAEFDENGTPLADQLDLPAQEIADEVRYARGSNRNQWLIRCAVSRPE
jgi:hypothetical protein